MKHTVGAEKLLETVNTFYGNDLDCLIEYLKNLIYTSFRIYTKLELLKLEF